MIAMLASIETFNDPAWFTDSGATNDCTPVAENLRCMIPYAGQEKLVVRNGTSLEIKAICNSYFSSNFGQFSLHI